MEKPGRVAPERLERRRADHDRKRRLRLELVAETVLQRHQRQNPQPIDATNIVADHRRRANHRPPIGPARRQRHAPPPAGVDRRHRQRQVVPHRRDRPHRLDRDRHRSRYRSPASRVAC